LDTLGSKYITVDAFNLPIASIIQSVCEELGVNYFVYSTIQGNTTISFSKLLFDDFLTYVLQGTNYTYKIDHNIYLIGERKLEGLRANRVYQFKFRSLDAILEIIPTDLRNGVEIKEFKELNSILLSGSLPQINEIEIYIKELDRVVPLVLIEVILIDVRKNRSISTGIRAGLSDSVKTGGTILPGVDFAFSSKSINDFLEHLGTSTVNIGRVTPNFYVGISALERNNNVDVRSMPKLSTLNGHEASLSIGSKRYYSLKTQNVLGSLNPQTVVTQQFQSVEANLNINIKPVVSGDDQVTLTIDVNISDFLGEPSVDAPPPTSTSQFKSIIRVRNEEMVVLGGIERTEKTDGSDGVPLLSRIPVLKWLFSSRTKGRNKLVSVVFIKPTIIY
jgi:type IV pilus assembly protein PilQ